ncbi:MAG: acetylglutamate kinase [Deltaproteobacteria bacterium CG_4_9_14_3_um_filter_44_9]|nr:MAG: acetylglutamate kinase [Deltaproteobacteria bacterium CG2_30_43_15]PIZ21146.1 MAG: acetylglutamate kinase [Deltaproteobacteria bacterium CG_4_10_14_0_8_um_filter_43_12]PJB41278.1 MAG: acetylglutamate kinase [Deltaproteobacteria bacterium CG_4_9_14_3_um_filter_44_9]HCX91006.1 acetylglutamate kinase [Deltaproteobacteria bacterium]
MEKFIDKAEVLIEALPYIRRFYNKTIVIKYGGHAMVDNDLKVNFALDVILMKYVGFNPIIVHGGGPQIGKVLEKMGKPSKFIDGMRVTDLETMDIVEMVLVGKINKEIVGLINHHGGQAVGLSGKDGQLIMARKLDIVKQKDGTDAPEIIDIGMVGEVESINPNVIEALDRNKFIPVIAPIGIGSQGETYNINADLVAGKIASALRAEKMVLLTDVEGLLDEKKRLISTIDSKKVRKYIKEGIISEGMIPKVTCCLEALTEGVVKTHIIDGRVKHALLLEVFTDVGVGTEIVM